MARYCLARGVSQWPEKPALIIVKDAAAPLDAAEHWSYQQLDLTIRAIAGGLQSQGWPSGARVLLRLGNTSDSALLFFAAIAAGFVPVPLSSMLKVEEVRFLLEDSGACVLVSNDPQDEALAFPVPVWDSSRLAQLKESRPVDYADTDAEDPAFLIYTSGTTSRPKGVLHAHRSAWGRRPMYEGWYGMNFTDIMLHAGALNWTYTLGAGLTDPWALGATAVVYNGPKDIHVWPRLIEKTGATLFAAVPSLYRQMLKHADLGAYDLSRLRHGLTAGEALHPELLVQWQAVTGRALYEALGMSECSTYISSAPGVPVRPGSPGKPQSGRCIAILPIEGSAHPLPSGETGLLAVHRSDPGLMLGYWHRPEEEAQAYRGDWFVGGDLASLDADGYVYYHGRYDDIMNCMGYRVSPVEVENRLIQHPEVLEVAVTAWAVNAQINIIAAFVVPKRPDFQDERGLLEFAQSRLAAYKCPRKIIFVDHLPRTTNGKIQRRHLGNGAPTKHLPESKARGHE
jgi:acyl-coenzyme A synthetase/AMP-(fatty) acid ligase